MKNKMVAVVFLLGFVLVLSSCNRYVSVVRQSQYQERTAQKDVLKKEGLSFSVSFGFDKIVKNGRHARALINVSSEKDFSGTLQAEFATQGMGTVAYARELEVTAAEDMRIEMAIPMQMGNDEIRFSIKDTKDKEILYKKEKVKLSFNEGIYYVGVLTDKKQDFSAFNIENMKLIFLSKEDFPEDVLCLDMFDTMILYDFERLSLNKGQQQALDEFHTKEGVQQIDELPLDGSILSEQILQSITLEKRAQIEREKYGYNSSYAAYTSTGIKGDGSIPKVGGYAIVIVLYLFLAGPPLYILLKKLNKQGAIWMIVPLLSIGFTLVIFGISTKTRLKEPYAGYFIINNVKENMVNQETYFTLTAPFNKSYIVDIPKTYEVAVKDMNYVFNGTLNLAGALNEGITITKKEDITQLSIEDSAAFDNKYFYAVTTKEQGTKLESTISMGKDYKVYGSVTNTMPYDLDNALLCVGDTYIMLGDIKQGETKQLGNEEEMYIVSTVNLYGDKLLEKLSNDHPNAAKREERAARISSAYQYFLEARMSSFLKEDVVLVGFVEEEKESANHLFGKTSVQTDGIEMVTIGAQADYTSGGETFIPNLDVYIKAENPYYYDTYRNMSGETMKFKICFEPEDTIKSLIYSRELNAEFYEKSWVGFYGDIKAYNQQTRQYDVLFESGKEDEITNVNPYLDTNNAMSILVESDVKEAKDRGITLPVLSAVKETE